MAQIRVENLRKSFDQFTAVHDFEFHHRKRHVLCAARTFGLRQDDDAAHDRRPRASDRRTHIARRRGRHLPPRCGARHRLRLSAVCSLSAHERRAEHRLSAQMSGHAAPRDSRAGQRDRAAPAHRASALEQDLEIVRRRSAARRARARHGPAPEGVPDGRAARRARRRISAADVRRTARSARSHLGDHDLCHARSARGDVDGGSHRRHERRQDRADRTRRKRSTIGRPACLSPTSSARRR